MELLYTILLLPILAFFIAVYRQKLALSHQVQPVLPQLPVCSFEQVERLVGEIILAELEADTKRCFEQLAPLRSPVEDRWKGLVEELVDCLVVAIQADAHHVSEYILDAYTSILINESQVAFRERIADVGSDEAKEYVIGYLFEKPLLPLERLAEDNGTN
jgi:hypothetical protein